MAVKREKIHFESVDELLGAPTFKDGTEEIKIDKMLITMIGDLNGAYM
jgi:ParB family chromosome partitioning protein